MAPQYWTWAAAQVRGFAAHSPLWLPLVMQGWLASCLLRFGLCAHPAFGLQDKDAAGSSMPTRLQGQRGILLALAGVPEASESLSTHVISQHLSLCRAGGPAAGAGGR